MTPHEFITKWRASELKERSASKNTPSTFAGCSASRPRLRPTRPARRTASSGAPEGHRGDGWADVWKRHHFAWEYKGRRADLDAAFGQHRQYALALENPPLLIVSDMRRFRIRTNWTNSVSKSYELDLDDLADAAARDRLKWAFSDPERLRPGETRQSLTERAAASFATVAAGPARPGPRPAPGSPFREPARLLHVRRRRGPAARPHGRAGPRLGVDRRPGLDSTASASTRSADCSIGWWSGRWPRGIRPLGCGDRRGSRRRAKRRSSNPRKSGCSSKRSTRLPLGASATER